MEHESVSIGILGFGDRGFSCAKLMILIEDKNIKNILIFWNQPTENIRKEMLAAQHLSAKITITFCDDNLGSAGGYIRLLEQFNADTDTKYLLLLDDDLHLHENCINSLITTATTQLSNLDETIFLAYRPKLPEIEDLVLRNIGINRPRNGCCVAFHIYNLLQQHREPVRFSKDSGLFCIDSAPWGGLFIPRQALPKLGMPREDFFLYAEDSELTHRFTKNGGKIFLVPDAVIMDTEPAWNIVGGNISNLRRRVLVLPEIKVFHEVRNRNYIARHYHPGFLLMYWINKSIFLASAYFIGMTSGKFDRARLIHRAIDAGEIMAAKEVSQ